MACKNPAHVVIIAVVTEVAWNVNKICVYALSIPLFMLSNIVDTINKQTMTMAGYNCNIPSQISKKVIFANYYSSENDLFIYRANVIIFQQPTTLYRIFPRHKAAL